MKKLSLLLLTLVSFGVASYASPLIDIQFGGNDFNGGSPVSDLQTGAGLVGSVGDQWNDFTSTSALLSGVSLIYSTGTATGATLTVSGPSVYQYAVGPAGTSSGGSYSGANQLGGTLVGNLAQGELGAGWSATLTLSFTGLVANTDFSIYLYSNPDRWERSSSWSVNGGAGTTVGPLNSYTGPYAVTLGYAPYVLVEGINYIVLSGTTDSSGNLTIAGTGLSSEPDINGLQLQAVPEPSTFTMILGSLGLLTMFRRRRA
ncbi:MAG: PEP-CTERM sorting domain-containing protein [Verrucomicrobiota bacterium]